MLRATTGLEIADGRAGHRPGVPEPHPGPSGARAVPFENRIVALFRYAGAHVDHVDRGLSFAGRRAHHHVRAGRRIRDGVHHEVRHDLRNVARRQETRARRLQWNARQRASPWRAALRPRGRPPLRRRFRRRSDPRPARRRRRRSRGGPDPAPPSRAAPRYAARRRSTHASRPQGVPPRSNRASQ